MNSLLRGWEALRRRSREATDLEWLGGSANDDVRSAWDEALRTGTFPAGDAGSRRGAVEAVGPQHRSAA